MEHKRIQIAIYLLAIIIASGTFGYAYFEKMTLFDAFYMTLITISTVGFSEIKPLSITGRMLTVGIIVSGISVLTYTLGQILKIFVEGELRRILGRRKVQKRLSALKNHYIICGYGRIGTIISQELASENIPFVVIENDPAKNEQLESAGMLYLNLDATTEEALTKAGIMRAKGIITAVRSDANNVFIALTAKGLRSDIFILSRASDEKNQDKLIRAGATRVVCPYQMGGRRMAQILKRPTVSDFIDTTTIDGQMGLRMEEIQVGADSELAGQTLVGARLRQDFGVMVVAVKKASNGMVFNPQSTEQMDAGDVLVVIGKKDDLDRLHDRLV